VNDAYTALLAAVLRAPDPVAALEAAAARPEVPEALRDVLAGLDRDGVRMSALLVAQLRFNRLLNGSGQAAADFDADPAGFTAQFRQYHQEVAPSADSPVQEARLFAAWWAGVE